MRRPGSVLLFAALSLALHLAWVTWMPELQRPSPAETHWVELSFEEAAPAAAPVVEAAPVIETAPTPQIEVAKAQPRERAQTSRPKPPARESAVPVEPTAAETPPTAPEPTAAPRAEASPAAPSGVAKPLAILPRSAALSLDAFVQGSALRCGQRATGEQKDCEPTSEQSGQAAQSALTRDLNGVARHVPHLKPREHPVLKRRSDGSYSYENGVFQATVRPDGKVEFRDTSIRSELHVSWVPFTVVADLNDVVERDLLGRELYSAEKQWLLDETRELREKLAGDARRRELLDANRALERTLRGILDDQALSIAQKHEAVFLLWQDCGEDAQAQAHRRAVDSFVQRYMPKDSTLGFRAEELVRFNTSRPRLQRFEPYAGT
jgi:hypothetical protein